MIFLNPAVNPTALLETLATAGQPAVSRMYAPGFEDIFATMPQLDSRVENPEALALTVQGMNRVVERVREKSGKDLQIPQMGPNGFGRIYLGIEEPRIVDGTLRGGTEVFLALWGEGFTSPVHGHAPGYINEELIRGAVKVMNYEMTARPSDRLVLKTTEGIQGVGRFVSFFDPDLGQETRSTLIHNFTALEASVTIHYVPEHARNGIGNRFTVAGSRTNGPFVLTDDSDLIRFSGEEALHSQVGDVYLVRSKRVAHLTGGDHAILIVGGLVQKPHGLRPNDAIFPLGESPLQAYGPDEDLVLLKLGPKARREFYEHFSVAPEFRRD